MFLIIIIPEKVRQIKLYHTIHQVYESELAPQRLHWFPGCYKGYHNTNRLCKYMIV